MQGILAGKGDSANKKPPDNRRRLHSQESKGARVLCLASGGTQQAPVLAAAGTLAAHSPLGETAQSGQEAARFS